MPLVPVRPLLLACAVGCAVPDPAPSGLADRSVRCRQRHDTFAEAVVARHPGTEDPDRHGTTQNFMASTRDGSLTAQAALGPLDGTLALQSRRCDDAAAHPGSCNVVGFDGNLLGMATTPDGATRVDAGWWCADAGAPLSFAGVVVIGATDIALGLHLVDTGAPEPAWGPVADPGAEVFELHGVVWRVPKTCAPEDLPCGGRVIAEGDFVRSDRLAWERW